MSIEGVGQKTQYKVADLALAYYISPVPANTRTQELPTQDQTPAISTFGTYLPKPEDLGSCCIALCIRQSLEVVLSFAAIRRTTNNRCGSVCRRDDGSSFLSHPLLCGCRKQGFLGNYADIKSPCI